MTQAIDLATEPANVNRGSSRSVGVVDSIVIALFCVSGASGLMFEVVWSRMLSRLLGGTTWGVLAVLVSFMGGLGIGAEFWGKRAERSRRPLVLYGALELAIGFYALAAPLIFSAIGAGYIALQRGYGRPFGFDQPIRLLIACLAIAPPTFLMGGTLPVLTRWCSDRRGGSTGILAGLYAWNTFGAVVGCFVTGFILILTLGVVETNTLAAVIDVLIGGFAIRLGIVTARTDSDRRRNTDHINIKDDSNLVDSGYHGLNRSRYAGILVVAIASFSGFCGLAYEVLWTRGVLAAITDGTTYAFTAMLTAFLAGHAVGGRAARGELFGSKKRFDSRDAASWFKLGLAQTFVGIGALASIPLLVLASRLIFAHGGFQSTRPSFWSWEAPFYFSVCLVVMFPPAAFLGASFSLAARLYTGKGGAVGAHAGRLYLGATWGAIAGALVATWLLIPSLGVHKTVVALALAQAAIGAIVALFARGYLGLPARIYSVTLISLGAAAGFAINTLFSLDEVYSGWEPGRLLFTREGPGATVTVHEKRGSTDRVININGVNVAGTSRVFRTIQKLQGHLPLFLHPDPSEVLHIGFGSGGTCRSVSLRPEIRRIDVAEISPEVVQTSKEWFKTIHQNVLADPRVHLRIVDAREEAAVSSRKYDLILSDSVLPRFRGNASLYTSDYFGLCANKLKPGGIFSTWFALHGLSVDDFRCVIRSLMSVFPHVQIWYPNIEPNENIVILASRSPIVIDFVRFHRELARPAILADWNDVELGSAITLADFFLMGDRGAAAFGGSGPINTDDHPLLEFSAPKTTSRIGSWSANFAALLEHREPIEAYAVGMNRTDREAMRVRQAATAHKLRGESLELQARAATILDHSVEARRIFRRDLEAALGEYEIAIRIDRDDFDLERNRSRLSAFLESIQERKPPQAPE